MNALLDGRPPRKTKIVCTIGPASFSKKTLKKMYEAGMDCARINTAYGDLDQYRTIAENVRIVGEIPLMVDIKGPEVRLRVKRKRAIKKGDVIKVGFSRGEIYFNHDFYDEMNVGDAIYIDNGTIKMRVAKKTNETLLLSAMNDGEISDGKGVNIPNKELPIQPHTARDAEILNFASENDVEYIALSFTRGARDVNDLRSKAYGYKGAIIAKIENLQGVKNFEEIVDAADGIMVARGDLGVEIDLERVPLVQKRLIRLCNQKGKTVVTATDMLESMIVQPNPTRAEVSDVANAILDGTDATMLSGETSVGKYPVESVTMMAKIARETETAAQSQIEDEGRSVDISDVVSRAIHRICKNMPVDKVVTLTRSGYTARMIARFKLTQPIIAVTPESRAKRQLELVFGVHPVHIDYRNEKDQIPAVTRRLRSTRLVNDEETVLFTAAFRTRQKHASNLIEIHKVKEMLSFVD
jgi:pyruvate kinase